jgi:hypothetical protein
LFEFENVFDLDSNLGFKLKSAAKNIKNIFIFSWQPKIVFGPQLLAAHPFIFIFLDFIRCWPSFLFSPARLLSFWPDSGPLPYRLPPLVIKLPPPLIPSVTAVPPVPRASGH